ncbi:beta-ketoacyl synthase chain length factor [Aliikangiella coralliicola]|uniref:Beta-ketoacyl synthase chain length factor n=1 Tax=Aliikangiella coralliicola TaxID=2592383 RepID=A0A545UEH0_9GAMM|nr:beta-ketoacyl synthase chain length factor [Aliikangiella coralliicola]TQV87867.1 beta-ketoacyl synthase chain length factor [Aliikangiella coralliicola]
MSKKINFSIESWSAWSSSKRLRSDWIDWACGNSFSTSSIPPDFSQIPAMKRRRMSSLSKMAVTTGINCLSESQSHPKCVFASRHGELTRTVKILESIANQEDISPTDFSLSVHNTSLGLFSILTQNKQPATTVAGGVDTFGYGLLESCVLMSRFPDSKVLFVYHDEPLPDKYSEFKFGPKESICIALLLSWNENVLSGANTNVSMSMKERATGSDEERDLGESFLKHYLSGAENSVVDGQSRQWVWGR